MANEYDLKIKKQVDTLIARAEALTAKHQKVFRNSFIIKELRSFRNRHLSEVQEKEQKVAASRTTGKQYRTVNHTEESFKIEDKKKPSHDPVVEGDKFSGMSIDELKMYAKKEYGIDTKGITKEEDVLHLIEQYKIVSSADVLEGL